MEGWGGQTKMAGFCVQMYFPFFDFECPKTLQYWVDVQQGQSHSWGEGASLALVYHPSSDGVIIKIPYSLDVYYINQPHILSFLIGLVKTESDIIVRSVKSGVGRWTLVVT